MNLFKEITLKKYFYFLILVVALALPVASLLKVSTYRDSDVDVFVVNAGEVTAEISVNPSTVQPDQTATVELLLNSPSGENFDFTGYTFSILVPKELSLVGSEPALGSTFTSPTVQVLDYNTDYTYNSAYNEVKGAVTYLEPISVSFNNTIAFSFDVSVPSNSTSNSYDLVFRPDDTGLYSSAVSGVDSSGNNVSYLGGTLDPVTLTVEQVQQNADPTVSDITLAPSKSTYEIGEVIEFSVTASDDDGDNVVVDFSLDGSIFAADVSSSNGEFVRSFNTSNLSEGSHTISVTAKDTNGGTNSSSASFDLLSAGSLNNPPSMDTFNVSSGPYYKGQNINLSATASDSDEGDNVTKVEFLLDGSVVSTSTSSPYNHTLDTSSLSLGDHTVSAIAYDTFDATDSSGISTITLEEEPLDLSTVTDLNLALQLEGTEKLGNPNFSSERVFVGVFKPEAGSFSDKALVATNDSGNAAIQDFFANNGSAYTLETTDLIVIKPQSYLSRVYTVGDLIGSEVTNPINSLTLDTTSDLFLAGDPLSDASGNAYNVGGQDITFASDFDRVTVVDYIFYKFYLGNRICFMQTNPNSDVLASLLDFDRNDNINAGDYVHYNLNLNEAGDMHNYSSSLLSNMETDLKQDLGEFDLSSCQ